MLVPVGSCPIWMTSAQFPQRRGGDLVGRAIGGIDDHASPSSVMSFGRCAWHIRCSAPAASSMRFARPILSEAATSISFGSSSIASILSSSSSDSFEAVRPEDLDAIVRIRIMRGRNHHAEIGAHRARQHGRRPASGSARTGNTSIPAARSPAVSACFDHVAGEAGILDDDDAVPVAAAAVQVAHRHADLQPCRRSSRPGSRCAHTPSVPKYFRAIFLPHPQLESADIGIGSRPHHRQRSTVALTSCTRRMCAPLRAVHSAPPTEPLTRFSATFSPVRAG